MLSRLVPLLACAASAFAAIEVVKVPGAEDLHEPFSIAFDAQGDAYGVEFQPANRVFKWHGGKIEYISGVKWNSMGKPKPMWILLNPSHRKNWLVSSALRRAVASVMAQRPWVSMQNF